MTPQLSPLAAITAAVAAGLLSWRGRLRFALLALLLMLGSGSVWQEHRSLERAEAGATRVTVELLTAPQFSRGGNSVLAPQQRVEARVLEPVELRGLAVRLIGDLGAADWGSQLDVSGDLVETVALEARRWLLFARESNIVAAPAALWQSAAKLRVGLREEAQSLPGPGAELIPGLAIGDTSRVSIVLDRAMRQSGLSHLTAVSGANCAVVVGLVFLLARRLGAPRLLRVGLAIAALGLFVLMVTPQPSVIRAATMASIALLFQLRGQTRTGVAILGLAVCGLLLWQPWLSHDIGFALSVLATAAILLLAPPLARRFAPWLGSWALLLAVPLAAQLACLPIVLSLTPVLNLGSVLANLLAAWLAPAATVIGLAACLALPLLPWLGGALLWLANFPATLIAQLAIVLSEADWLNVSWWPGVAGVLSALLLSIMICLAAVAGRRVRRAATAIAAVVLTVTVGSNAVAPAIVAWARPQNWAIAQCDVGQGDALVLRAAEHFAVIDTGPSPVAFSECLAALGIERIDLLVLSHFDADHVGGSSAVFGRVAEVLVGPSAEPNDDRLRRQFEAGGALVRQVARGVDGTLGDTPWRVLWPLSQNRFEPGNPSSLTMQFSLPFGEAVFLGDLGEESQRALLRAGVPQDISVVKVAHHGSADQYDELYRTLSAEVALIGVGSDNNYGHPTEHALAMQQSAGSFVVRSDQQGLSLLALAGATGSTGDPSLQIWSSERAETSAQSPAVPRAEAAPPLARLAGGTERYGRQKCGSKTRCPRLEPNPSGGRDFGQWPQRLPRQSRLQATARLFARRRPCPRGHRP